MIRNRINFEFGFYALALLTALFVRFMGLGAWPLTEFEAGWANQALALARSTPTELGPAPGYVSLTGLLFFIFGATNFLARFWPALAGSLLVTLPIPFRRLLGRRVAIALAFGLALDPGLIAVSRLGSGHMLALSLGLLALAALYHRRLALAGFLGGLALLSGVPFLQGAVILAAAWLMGRWLERSSRLPPLLSLPPGGQPLHAADSRLGIGFLLGSVLFLGTLFFRAPQSLGALAGSLPAYLQGWVGGSGVPVLRLLAALVVYQPFPLIFAGVHLFNTIRGKEQLDARTRWLSLWLGLWLAAALIFVLLYPGRQVADLVWMLVPLWGLAALGIVRLFSVRIEGDLRLVIVAQAVMVFALAVFMWINLAGMARSLAVADPVVVRNFWIIMVGAAVMIVIATSLVVAGWNWQPARVGLAWGLGVAVGIYTLSVGMASLRPAPDGSRELWTLGPAAGQADLLYETISSLSEQQTGHDRSLEVVVLADLPSLRWMLRDWPHARFAASLAAGDTPALIITPEGIEIALAEAKYMGQDFAWSIYPAEGQGLASGPAAWLVYRDGNYQTAQIILWARADMFPGGVLNPEAPVEETTPPDQQPVENRLPVE